MSLILLMSSGVYEITGSHMSMVLGHLVFHILYLMRVKNVLRKLKVISYVYENQELTFSTYLKIKSQITNIIIITEQ